MPRLILERHAYAPEMNRAHVLHKGRAVAVLPCPGCTSIRDARARLFRPACLGLFARVAFTRPAPWQGLDMNRAGRVKTRAEGLAYCRGQVATRHAGGVLLDGSTLPPASYRLSFAFT